MSDKLLVEIDMHNGELEDAVPALIFLANELVEAGTIDISSPVDWREKIGNAYQVKWRFAEDEVSGEQIPLDLELVFKLNDVLKSVEGNISEKENFAIKSLRTQLEAYLPESRTSLLTEMFS